MQPSAAIGWLNGQIGFGTVVALFLFSFTASAQTPKAVTNGFSGFHPSAQFNERLASFILEPGVKVHINAPAESNCPPDKKISLIFYTLPNGNTTEQTIGKKMRTNDDWHFDIQHIGAQTRWLRETIKDRTIVVIYLEAQMKSWPSWRKTNGDEKIPEIISTVRKIFSHYRTEVILASHSGGGSFIFGYLNAVPHIPDDVVRIAFLDSNYAYDSAKGHTTKLAEWLKASDHHYLSILAYNDAAGLLNGKPFVSAAGGTWGKSHEMLKDFEPIFHFTNEKMAVDGLEKESALDGRFEFLLKENPDHKILHTVQVERNGFIQTMLSGTAKEGKGYVYFGDRAYSKWIQDP